MQKLLQTKFYIQLKAPIAQDTHEGHVNGLLRSVHKYYRRVMF